MEFYTGNEVPPMRAKNGTLKSPPYYPNGERKKLKAPETANIIPLEHIPFCCRQEEQGSTACSDRNLEKKLGAQLKLSVKLIEEVDRVRQSGQEVFTHTFGAAGTWK